MIYDKETDTPAFSLNRNSVMFWGDNWMDEDWENAFRQLKQLDLR